MPPISPPMPASTSAVPLPKLTPKCRIRYELEKAITVPASAPSKMRTGVDIQTYLSFFRLCPRTKLRSLAWALNSAHTVRTLLHDETEPLSISYLVSLGWRDEIGNNECQHRRHCQGY